MILPILLICLLCLQVCVRKTTMRKYETNILDALVIKSDNYLEKKRRERELPSNLRGFKLRWTQKVKRKDGSISIYTPWYFKPKVGYTIAAISLCVTIAWLAQDYPWGHLLNVPMAMGTTWTDVNTAANAKFTDMDGAAAPFVDGDIINCATHNLQVDASKTSGATTLTAGTFTVDATKVLTQGGNLLVGGASSITGTVTPLTYTDTFNGAVTVNNGGVLGGNTAWVWNQNANLTNSIGGTINAPATINDTAFVMYNVIFTNSGVFNHDNGQLTTKGDYCYIGSATFYDLKTTRGTSHYFIIYPVGAIVICEHLFTSGSWVTCDNSAGIFTLKIGTASAAGSFVACGREYGGVGATLVVQGFSVSYPAVVTGTDFNWDNAGKAWQIKWLDYQIDAVTGGGGCTVNWTGNMKTKSWTTTVGDTLVVTDGITITGVSVAATKYVNAGTWTWGTFTISLVDIQFDVTTPGTGKTITVAGNLGVDGVTVAATDTWTWGALVSTNAAKNLTAAGTMNFNFNGTSITSTIIVSAGGVVSITTILTSTKGFTCAATGALTITPVAQFTIGANCTTSGTITVNGALNLAGYDINTSIAKNGTLTGHGIVRGLISDSSAVYVDTYAAGADVIFEYATLSYTTNAGGLLYTIHWPGIDAGNIIDLQNILNPWSIDDSNKLGVN